MSSQMALAYTAADRDKQTAFEEYHSDHPEFYRLIVRFAREAKAAGCSRYSIDALFHRIRWHVEVETKSAEFKVNNNYTSRYARLVMQQEPDLADFFETRVLKGE